jgi:DNA-binding response OmpR family regulator
MVTASTICKKLSELRSACTGPTQALTGMDLRNDKKASDVIEAGDFRMNIDARTATARGRELDLSGAEFDVLVYLVSNRKRIVTARTTLASKSDYGGMRETEFLRALMALRKKLQERVPGIPYIQTEGWILYEFHPGT